jgi:hypothetical protein
MTTTHDHSSTSVLDPARLVSDPLIAAERRPISAHLLSRIDSYWRAANYLSVGQLYLYDNPLLKTPLELSHVKPLVVGHWGTTPGQNFIYVHLNRAITAHDLDMFYVPAQGTVARRSWLTRISRAVTARSIRTSARTSSV